MNRTRPLLRVRPRRAASIAAIAAVATLSVALGAPGTSTVASVVSLDRGCPPGYEPGTPTGAARDTARRLAAATQRPLLSALDSVSAQNPDNGLCVRVNRPESPMDMMALQTQRAAAAAAPFDRVPVGVHRAAINQRQKLLAATPSVANANGSWAPVGKTPLIADSPDYGSVNGEGLADLAGRIDSFAFDPVSRRLFATIGTGGVWMSTDEGGHWRSVGDSLPGQEVGAVGWTAAGGGTLVIVGGEPLMGGDTYAGLGAFWSNDLGDTWHQSVGIPDGLMGFQIAVDEARPSIVYAATSMGLFRSINAGRTFVNVNLPTGHGCTGNVSFTNKCLLANFVTDVVVKAPGGVGGGDGSDPASTVLAAVGYRGGLLPYPNSVEHSPSNGLYKSSTGAPGTFTYLDNFSVDGISPIGFALQDHIGRTELGTATGPNQDHDYVYAIVQDAVLLNGGIPVIDVNEGPGTDGIPNDTVFNGVYVSDDFGSTWTRMGDDTTISHNPLNQSALVGGGTAQLYSPGAQSWYDMWIQPDPSLADGNGVPTRLLFGMEEVWASKLPIAQDGPMFFQVIGPYFSGETCEFRDLGLPVCPATGTTPLDKTTHPDQHDGIFLPDADGSGVTLMVGNDGGAYTQHADPGENFTNKRWGRGNQAGFHTLLPYDAEPAADGTIWFGLQDNGSGKVTPDGTQYMTFGGDGFWVAVDPNNSKYAWSEVTNASMRVTVDGGKTWRTAAPGVSSSQFANPFVMDPTNAKHLLTAGNEVAETTFGADTGKSNATEWKFVYDLGNLDANHPNQMSSVELQGASAYVGFCGPCNVWNNYDVGFHNGLATNVGGSQPAKSMTNQGWHKAKKIGLPNRFITAIAIDPDNPKTVYLTLGGYDNREWIPPGSYLDTNNNLGAGHVFVSHNAGDNFTDISGNLPDTEASEVELRGNQLLVGTDIGAFISSDLQGSDWAALGGGGLPAVPVSSLHTVPGASNLVIAGTFGRGVYCYQFPGPGAATCANRGANFRPPPTTQPPAARPPLATTGLPMGVALLATVLVGMGVTVAVIRRRRGSTMSAEV